MTDAEVAREVKALISFYERRRANWLLAAEFTLAKHSTSRSDGRICSHICMPCRHSEMAAQRRKKSGR
jgi:hypothetical protein